MTFGSKHYETAKLGPQRVTVKSSEAGLPPLLEESYIVLACCRKSHLEQILWLFL